MKKALKEGKVDASAAAEIAELPPEAQNAVIESGRKKVAAGAAN